MARPTVAQACFDRGISIPRWYQAKRAGIDPWDRKALSEWLRGYGEEIAPPIPKRKKRGPEERPDPAAALVDNPELDALTLEQMEDRIRRAPNLESVKLLKEQVAALKITTNIRESTRELVPMGEVRESITRVYSATRGELLKLPSDCAPRLEGLQASEIQEILREEIISILERLSNETNALYD